MIRSVVIASVLLSQGACVPQLIMGAGAGASIYTASRQADQDISTVLALDRPIKEAICAEHPVKSPAFAAWCDNLPSDLTGLMKQWAAVAVMREVGRRTSR